ncbi:MAG: AAA family ATPase [Candidatus Methanoplasma sp.]|jgi:predicted ATPase|nr:AAA family ATPase [Candidatus Methanoplasma sp.]
MMLRSFAVYGLFNEYNYDVPLSDGNLTFIHSQNGFGKSTIMKLIYNALTGDLDSMRDVLFERLDLRFDDGSCMIIENNGEDLLVQMQKNEVEEDITAEDMRKILNTVYVSPLRQVVSCDGNVTSAAVTLLKGLSEKMGAASEERDLPRPKKGALTDLSDEELEFKSKDLKARLEFIRQAGIEPIMPSGHRFPPTRFEIMEYRKVYEDLASSVETYVDRYYTLAESIVVYIDIINSLFINKEIFINEMSGLNVRMKNGTAIPINKLSSGEEQLLVIFYRLLFQTDAGSLAIIDEPEISLHVSWQQRIGSIFSDIARLRSLQVIVATHSPQIIHDSWDLAAELKVDNDR